MDADFSSDSDQELDRQELEVALYSQIHFDSCTQSGKWQGGRDYDYPRLSHSLRIGVKELPSRITPSLKQPIFGGEFLAFSGSNNDNDSGSKNSSRIPYDLPSSYQDKDKIIELHEPVLSEQKNEHSKGNGVVKDTFLSSLDTDRQKAVNVVQHQTDSSSISELNRSTDNFEKSVKSAACGSSQLNRKAGVYKKSTLKPKCSELSQLERSTDVYEKSAVKPTCSESAQLEQSANVLEKLAVKPTCINAQEFSSGAEITEKSTVIASSKSAKFTRNADKSDNKPLAYDNQKDVSTHKLSSIPNDLTGVNKSNNEDSKHRKLATQETGTPPVKVQKLTTAKLKRKEVCLPFSLTRAPMKQKVAETESISIEKEKTEAQPASVSKKKITNKLIKLESFLELPKSGVSGSVMQKKEKRASLSKTYAAVKPRTPTIVLRRPPAVTVKYRQDSDTNTDYSDSETSISGSPMKKQRKTVEDKSLYHSPVSEDYKPITTSNNDSVLPQEQCQNSVPARHQRGKSDEAVMADDKPKSTSNRPESLITTTSHDVSISSEEDESETDEDSTDDSNDDVQEVDEEESDTSGSSLSQEESSSGSEDTDSSDPAEFMEEHIPGLQFNLDREVAALPGKNPGNWKINEKDRLNVTSSINRYFFARAVQCRNCRKDGHLSRDCPQPLKRRCIFCGMEGHSYQACPEAVCFNCSAPGHRVNECREKKIRWTLECDRCWMPGHDKERCPDRWRQYHITVSPTSTHVKKDGKGVRNPLVFCYNCGKKGHLGFECSMPRMNKFTTANYPFVAHYDSEKMCAEVKIDKKRFPGSSKVSPRVDKPKKQHSSWMKNKEFNNQLSVKELKVQRLAKNDDHAQPKKKRRRRNDRGEDEHWASVRSGGSSHERNHPAGSRHQAGFRRERESDYSDLRRLQTEVTQAMDDILTDYGKHQVNDNEWWKSGGKPVKKKRRNDEMGDDWQRNRQKGREIFLDNERTFPGSLSYEFDSHRHGKYQQKNTPMRKDDFKRGHGHFTPKFQFEQQTEIFGDNSRTDSCRKHTESDLSAHMPGHEYRASFNTQTSKKSMSQHPRPAFKKTGLDFSHRQNGFQFRNDRFVAIKRDHSISVSIRK